MQKLDLRRLLLASPLIFGRPFVGSAKLANNPIYRGVFPNHILWGFRKYADGAVIVCIGERYEVVDFFQADQ